MVLGDVQRLEVQLVGLDLGSLEDDEPELAEDARDLLLGLAQMDAATRATAAGRAA